MGTTTTWKKPRPAYFRVRPVYNTCSWRQVVKRFLQVILSFYMFVCSPALAATALWLYDRQLGTMPEAKGARVFYAGIFVGFALLHSWAYLKFFTWRK
jgi:hypothetical protein